MSSRAVPHPVFNALYPLLWKAARPFLRRHKRLRDSFARRLAPPDWGAGTGDGAASVSRDARCDCWIQAASGGESFLARRLVLALAALYPGKDVPPLRVLCTTCTRQGMDVLEALRREAETALPNVRVRTDFFPLDEPALMREALSRVTPRAVALLETELWPGLMAACAEKNIPMFVLNGRMRDKSLAGYRYLSFFWKRAAPEKVLAISEADAARFAALFGPERVAVMPNMKFETLPGNAALPGDAASRKPGDAASREPGGTASREADGATPCEKNAPDGALQTDDKSRTAEVCNDTPASALYGAFPVPPVLLASVREEEEELLLPHLEEMLRLADEKAPGASLVIAPRHMERVPFWRERLRERPASLPAPPLFRSEWDETAPFPPGRVIVWDRFGELASLYAVAGAVFVGGSLAPLGGQNFLEPASAGLVPRVGPSRFNFAWAEELFAQNLARSVENAAGLPTALAQDLAEYLKAARGGEAKGSDAGREAVRRRYAAFIARKQGGSRQAAALLLARIKDRV